MPTIRFDLDHPSLRLAVVTASGITCTPSSGELKAALERAELALREDPSRFAETTRTAIRNVLRRGGYKPTGRGKPASEFLLGAALEGGMPRINNLVDTLNLVSLTHAHPISLFDAELLGDEVSIRFGQKGENYVFNASGHSMDIAGLPVICRKLDEAVGNAVKDSMTCKVHAETKSVVAVVYGTSELALSLLEACAQDLARLLTAHAGAQRTETQLLPIAP